jgi:SAM-dependent methyltransferase
VEYYIGYAWKVFDCPECGCRFTRHDESVYEVLHTSGAVNYYNDYHSLATECKAHFDRGDVASLESLLEQTPKYRFILDQLKRVSHASRILEVGCSRGYLTSCSILAGRDILGVDVSATAVAGARAAFGEHFELAEAALAGALSQFDVVYHVGLIGCVADPLGLTRQLLSLLKPGGKLLFNVPNRRACGLRGQLWFDSAPPPDVVTLFPPGFWSRFCAADAEVDEREEFLPSSSSTQIGLRKILRRHWKKPVPRSIQCTSNGTALPRDLDVVWRKIEKVAVRAGRMSGLSRFISPQPSEYGLFVSLTKPRRVSQ